MSNDTPGYKTDKQPLLHKLRQLRSLIRLHPFETVTAHGRSQERYRRILWITASGLATRIATAAVGLISVPLALSYFGKEKYGLWATITSFVAWTSLFDFGIVNSLVNALSEANGKDDREAARSYVSTAFFLLLAVSVSCAVAFVFVGPRISWIRVFAVKFPTTERTVMWAVVAALACVLAALPLSVVRQVYAGYQKSYIANVFNALGALVMLAALYTAVWTKGDMPSLVLAFAGPQVIIGLFNFVYLTRKEMPWLSPQLRLISRKALKRLCATSTPLFLFQLGALLVSETQLIVLAHVTSLKMVSEYSILWRLAAVFASLIALGTGAFVPAFREAHERGDTSWVRRSFRRMLALRMVIATAAALALISGGNWILRLWLHSSSFRLPLSVRIAQGVFLVGSIWVTSFSELMVIMDRIWIQVAMVLVNGVITVALTIFLAPQYGLLGAVAAIAFVTICFWTWMVPILVRPILSGKAATSRPPKVVGTVEL